MLFSGKPEPREQAARRRRLDPNKWNRLPVQVQILGACLIAAAMIIGVEIFVPDMAHRAKQMLGLVTHEVGHVVGSLALGGSFETIILQPDGSGEAHVTTNDHVFSAAMGPLLPPILAAVFLTLAVMRVAIAPVLFVMAIPLFWLGYEHFDLAVVKWSLWGWALFCLVTAISGMPHILRSAAMIVVAATLALGAYDSLPYLWVEYVSVDGHGLAQSLPDAAADDVRPSDVRIIADNFGYTDVTEVRRILIGLMIVAQIIAAVWIARFIYLNRTT